MAKIQLVVEIEERYYEIIKNDVERGMDYMPCVLIAKGQLLPKGHGDLVDRDAINDRFYNIWKELESYSNKPTYKKLLDRWSMCMDTAQPVIKADKEEEDGTNY